MLPADPHGGLLPVRALPARRTRGDAHLAGRARRARARAPRAPALGAPAARAGHWRRTRLDVAPSAPRRPHVWHLLPDRRRPTRALARAL